MTQGRPFDMTQLDFEAIRKKKRKQLLSISAPFIVIVLATALWLGLPTLLTASAVKAFDQAQYSTALKNVSMGHILNLIEPYKAFYNQGTALAAKGDLDSAMMKLETALAYTNDSDTQCVITRNLVLVMESSGDQKVQQAKLSDAFAAYTRTLKRLQANGICFKDPALEKRITDKLQAVDDARSKQVKKDTAGSPTNADQPSATQQQQLDKINAEANTKRTESQNSNHTYHDYESGVLPW